MNRLLGAWCLCCLMILLCNGCVTRTIVHPGTVHDSTTPGKNDKVLREKTLWFWERDFWR